MSKYKCERCDKIFSQKSAYDYHKNKINICNIILPDSFIDDEIMYIKMREIIKEISILRKDNKILKTQVEIQKKQINSMEKQDEIINGKKNIKKTNKTTNGDNHIEINGKNTTINKLTVINKPEKSENTIINFNKIMIYNLSKNNKEKILKFGFSSISELLNMTHFNKNVKTYRNVYINKFSDRKWCQIYEDGIWKMELTETVIDILIENSRKYIYNIFDEVEDKDAIRYIGINKLLQRFDGETKFTDENDWKIILDNIKNNIIKGMCNNKYYINSK